MPDRRAPRGSPGFRGSFRETRGQPILDFGSWQRDTPGNGRPCAKTRGLRPIRCQGTAKEIPVGDNAAQKQAQEDAGKTRALKKKKKQTEEGRSYTSPSGRAYTSSRKRKPAADPVSPAEDTVNAVKKLKGLLPW